MRTPTTFLGLVLICHTICAQTYTRTGYYQTWDTATSTWNDEMRLTHLFQPSGGRVLASTYDSLDVQWQPKKQVAFHYGTADVLDSIVIRLWDDGEMAWENSELKTATFNGGTSPISQQDHVWNGSSWVATYKYDHTYDVNGHLVRTQSSRWNGAWVLYGRDTLELDGSGNPIVNRSDTLNGTIWEMVSVDSTWYNGSGQRTETTTWISFFGMFIPSSITAWSHGADGEIDSIQTFLYWPNPAPIPYLLELRTQAGDGLLNQTFQRNQAIPSPQPDWLNYFRWIFDETGAGVAEWAPSPVRIWPNPSDGRFTMACDGADRHSQARVYDAVGRQIGGAVRADGAGRFTLDLDGEAPGIYRVIVSGGPGISIGTLTIRH